MSDLIKEYRKTMAAEVLHLWAADAVAEIARLRAELDNAASAAVANMSLACEKESEADALRVDSERLNWLESQVKEYGDGHYSRLEASLIFFWQQTKPDEVYPGFRESIDAAMGADA